MPLDCILTADQQPTPVRIVQFWSRNFRDGNWYSEPWYQFHYADGSVSTSHTCQNDWLDRIVNYGPSPSPEQQIINMLSSASGRVGVAKALKLASHYRKMAGDLAHLPQSRDNCIRAARAAHAVARGLLTGIVPQHISMEAA